MPRSSRHQRLEIALPTDVALILAALDVWHRWPLVASSSRGDRSPSARSSHRDNLRLDGLNILVVEDESLIALVLMDTIEEAGGTVIGPCYTLTECMRLARSAQIDAAILDVDLAGHDVFPAADELRQRNIPFIFHTGHGDREELRARFGDVHVCRKPTPTDDLLNALVAASIRNQLN